MSGDGSIVWGLTSSWRMPGSDQVMVEVQDVTAARRVSDLQLSLALDAAGMGAWDLDVESGAMRWTTSLTALLGLNPMTHPSVDAILGAVDPEDVAVVRAGVAEATRLGEPFDHDFRVRWPDGTTRWLLGRIQAQPAVTGNRTHIVGVVLDVTERRQVLGVTGRGAAGRRDAPCGGNRARR